MEFGLCFGRQRLVVWWPVGLMAFGMDWGLFFSPDVILFGWLGSKHQLTNGVSTDDRKTSALTK